MTGPDESSPAARAGPPQTDERQQRVDNDGDELKRALLAGILGAVAGSVGYLVYSRLEDEHKDALRKTVMKFVEEKVSDIRTQFKL